MTVRSTGSGRGRCEPVGRTATQRAGFLVSTPGIRLPGPMKTARSRADRSRPRSRGLPIDPLVAPESRHGRVQCSSESSERFDRGRRDLFGPWPHGAAGFGGAFTPGDGIEDQPRSQSMRGGAIRARWPLSRPRVDSRADATNTPPVPGRPLWGRNLESRPPPSTWTRRHGPGASS